MPPSAQRRTRTRKLVEPLERSDADDVESITTPSRKRRKVSTNETAQRLSAGDATVHHGSVSQRKTRSSDLQAFDEFPTLSQEEIDNVIRTLRKAKYEIQARIDYANEVHEVEHPKGKQAYAKIAGNGWTFYVNDLEVRIGRPPDEKSSSGQRQFDLECTSNDTSLVHIDLGPSKLVSRQHAEIRYDDRTGRWYIAVNGRNGIKLDETPLDRGETGNLRSGSVIDVGGTQMIFIAPNEGPSIHHLIVTQSRALREDNEDEDDDDIDRIQPPSRLRRTPTRGGGPRPGPQHRPSSSQNKSSGQQGTQGRTQSAYVGVGLSQHVGSTDSGQQISQLKEQASPIYSKGIMIESTEDIDYSLDTAKDLKPPQSYAQLIGMAILSSPEEKLTLSKIYDYIKDKYAFYRFSGGGWQNSIRHNLSLNKCFEKIARRTDEPGKGMKWQIVPEHRDEFLKKGLSNARKGAGRGSSAPTSPIKDMLSSMDNDRRFDNILSGGPHTEAAKPANFFIKTSPGSTPPTGTYPAVSHAYTPDRFGTGQGRLHVPDISSPRNGFGIGVSPFPYSAGNRHRFDGLTDAAAAGSPGGPTMVLGSDPHDRLSTPLIARHAPILGPPSTAQLPSHFMPMSSPAPFWKYAEHALGSTPARGGPPGGTYLGLSMSPLKKAQGLGAAENDEEDEQTGEVNGDDADAKVGSVHSSSPPLPIGEVGQESPTRTLSSRGGDRSQTQPPLQQSHALPSQGLQAHQPLPSQLVPRQPPSFGLMQGQQSRSVTQSAPPELEESDEEEVMIDLARGFQPIGSFHRNMNAGIIGGN